MPEIGYQRSALGSWADFADDENEPNPLLQWPNSNFVYDRMRSEDAQVQSVIRAVTFPILSARWMIDPAGARPEVVDLIAADFGLPVKGQDPVAPLRTKGRFSWGEHLRLALLALPFGHSYFEQVFEITDGKARLKKLAWRPQRTISKIDVAPDGGLVSITQYGAFGKTTATIPVDRLVAYVNDREGGYWLGRSILRAAYKFWLLKDQGLRTQALTLERNGLGVPTMEAPPNPEGLSDEALMQWIDGQIKRGLEIAKAYRSGEYAGVSLANGGKFTLNGVTGTLPDSDKPIRYYDEQIARAVLAHFLNLGTETGSWALGSTFANFFTDSLNAVAESIRSTTQQHVVEDLVDLNFGEQERAPQLVFEPIGSQFPATAEAIKALLEAGGLEADEELEAFLRQQYGLPIKGAVPRALPSPRTAIADQVAAIFRTQTPKEQP
jgi:hypothetical protein